MKIKYKSVVLNIIRHHKNVSSTVMSLINEVNKPNANLNEEFNPRSVTWNIL